MAKRAAKRARPARGRRPGQATGRIHLMVAEHPPGLEDLARAELLRRGQHRLKVVDSELASETGFSYQGSPGDLLRLRLIAALYQVYHFAVPRPRALLGQKHWQRLLGEIAALRRRHPAESFRTFRIAAAGRHSALFRRLRTALAHDTGLQYDEEAADLQLRIRPARLSEAGWELLLRLTPRPLTSRPWRHFDYPGALNGVVAAALVELSRPRRAERVLNLMCGSATWLIERALWGPARCLVGGDLDHTVLQGAAVNASNAGLPQPLELVQLDACRAPLPTASFDTILVDPPWGQLSGPATAPTELYPALLAECTRLAAGGAQLLVITHQIRLWEQLMAEQGDGWRLQSDRQLFQGGLHPRIYHYRIA